MNFRIEVLHKYDQDAYNLLMDSFDLMPLACLLNNKLLALHGGISPDLKYVDFLDSDRRYQSDGSIQRAAQKGIVLVSF